MNKYFFALVTLFASFAFANSEISVSYKPNQILAKNYGSFFDWGTAQNGYGYCYQWTSTGQVLNEGRPVPNINCEYSRPSRYDWGKGGNGYGYCYQWTPYGVVMNEGSPQSNHMCENYSPSYYSWGTGGNGYTYCYQYGNGLALNDGNPVPNYYCQ